MKKEFERPLYEIVSVGGNVIATSCCYNPELNSYDEDACAPVGASCECGEDESINCIT